MHIGLKKAQALVDRYYQGKTPSTETGRAGGTGRAEYFQDVFKSLPGDDNGPLDGNSERGIVQYNGGDQIGFTYVYDDKGMVSGSDYNDKGVYDEFEFSGDIVTQVSGRYNPAEGTGSLSATTWDLGENSTEEKRWDAFDNSQQPESIDGVELRSAESVIGEDLFAPISLSFEGQSEELVAKKKQGLKDMLAKLGGI